MQETSQAHPKHTQTHTHKYAHGHRHIKHTYARVQTHKHTHKHKHIPNTHVHTSTHTYKHMQKDREIKSVKFIIQKLLITKSHDEHLPKVIESWTNNIDIVSFQPVNCGC